MQTRNQILICFLLVLNLWAKGQSCVNGFIVFSSQAEVDLFAVNYPGCIEINGNVFIQGNINNLNALNNIEKINGKLNIVTTTLNQSNLFPNLKQITNSLLISNTGLSSLNGFNNLTTVNNKIEIYNNSNLATLNGFNVLTKTDTVFIGQQVNIQTAFTQIKTLKSLKIISYVTTGSVLQVSGSTSFNMLEKSVKVELHGLQNTNLNFLSNLDTVTTEFTINSFPNLNNLGGLSSLSYADKFSVVGCNSLANLNLSPNLKINKVLGISSNPALTNLVGLPSISQLDELVISNNDGLLSLEGLNNLNTVKSFFYIIQNGALTDISALDNLKIIGATLHLYENPSLNACCKIASLVTKNRILGEVQIYDNGAECSSLLDIIGVYCSDLDEDDVFDTDDNCPNDPNEDQDDTDNDGVGDACDNCPLVSNTNQADANNDGVGDACQSVSGVGSMQISSDVYVDNSLRGVILKSSNGFCYRIKVNNKGKLSSKKVACP